MLKSIVLYDEDCKLCNNIKNRIEIKDTNRNFRFIPQNSVIGKNYIQSLHLDKNEQNSIIFIDPDNNYLTKTNAIISILGNLKKYRILYSILKLFPKQIRDFGYNIIAGLRKYF